MMKKFIWISLVIILAACGSRKRNVQYGSTSAETVSTASTTANISVKSSSSGEITLSDILENRNLKITANGSPYQLQYGGMVLTGSADLEFSESKQERKTSYRYITRTTYQSKMTYKSRTQFETQTRYRMVDVERAGLSFGTMIWIIIATFIAGAVAWPLIKTTLSKWRINF